MVKYNSDTIKACCQHYLSYSLQLAVGVCYIYSNTRDQVIRSLCTRENLFKLCMY